MDIIWEMILGGVGGIIGVIFGLIFVYWLGVGDCFVGLFINFWFLVLDVFLIIGLEIFVFGLVGLGIGVGLIDVGGFG